MKKITIVALAMLALTIGVYAQSAPTPAPTTPTPTWEYTTNTDKMTGQVIRYACLDSSNQLNFAPPYDGGSRGTICLRSGDPRLGARYGEALIMISKGQFLCKRVDVNNSIAHLHFCYLEVKVDDNQLKNLSVHRSNDGSTNVFFVDGTSHYVLFAEVAASYKFLFTALKEANHVMIRATFFQEGDQVLEFDTTGLTWEWK
ncbi:MAG: hypothetical protein ABSC64_19690 [Candidatus Korobacteraceae bacterium]|jgi:hypothetical protein